MRQCAPAALMLVLLAPACGAGQEPRDDAAAGIRRIAVGEGPGSVAALDVDADGDLDLVVANDAGGSVTVLLGDGGGDFHEAAGSPFPAGPNPNDIAAADLDGDGDLDLLFPNHETAGVTVLIGDGRGGFRPAPGSPLPVRSRPHPHGIVAGDFDGDGRPDLAVESFETNQVEIIRGDGRGGFETPGAMIAVGPTPYQRLRSADLDRDWLADLVTTNRGDGTVSILLQGSGGSWHEADGSPFAVGEAPFAVAVGDLDGDQRPDLAIAHYSGNASDPSADRLSLWLGNGRGAFRPVEGSPFTERGSPVAVAIGDVDGDGQGDVAVARYSEGSIALRLAVAGWSEEPGSPFSVGRETGGVALADLNGDGRDDLIAAAEGEGSIAVLLAPGGS